MQSRICWSTLFPLDGHHSLLGHLFSIFLLTQFVDTTEAGLTVRLEDDVEKLAEEVVKLLAFMWIHLAYGTGVVSVIHAADAYFAPFCLFIFTTTGAFPDDKFTT